MTKQLEEAQVGTSILGGPLNYRHFSKEKMIKAKMIIDEYFVNGFNKRGAVRFVHPKKSNSACDTFFRRLVQYVDVNNYILEKQRRALQIMDDKHIHMLEYLKTILSADYTRAMSLTEEEIKKLPEDFRKLITGFKKVSGKVSSFEVQFISKEKVLEWIQKHIGFYGTHNKQKTPEGDVKVKVSFDRVPE